MRVPTVPDFLEWLGSLWGDQGDYLVCGADWGEPGCGRRFYWSEDDPVGNVCPDCGGTIYAHVPHSEELMIRYLCWKGDQGWMPQRMYVYPGMGEEPYRYVQWRGREWRRRPDPGSTRESAASAAK